MLTDLHGLLLIAFAILMIIVPAIVVRLHRRSWLAVDVATWMIPALLLRLAPLLGFEPSPAMVLGFFVTIKLAAFFIFLSWVGGSDRQRWSPLLAGAFAVVIYLILLPHQLQWPIDGDEPYYVLTAESIIQDGDVDLANQFREIESSAAGRPDLAPHPGEPAGRQGERPSRYEPFLSILLIPGLLLGGLPGAVITIVIFGGLLVHSLMRLIEEEGISHRAAVAVYPLLALGPPLLFYATRIWPEVPAAWCLSESIRATRAGHRGKLVALLVALSLLKLRFIPIAIGLLLVFLWRRGVSWRVLLGGLVALLLPMLVVWSTTGNPLRVHAPHELVTGELWKYVRGGFGLLLDGQGGLLFQAPLWFLSILSLLHWRKLPEAMRMGAVASLLYLLLLLPRVQWHGGWAPPLRYLIVFAPLFALGAAWMIERIRPFWIGAVALATAVLSLRGVLFPWRLFHIENGENVLGEFLSRIHQSDFSRLLPSFVRFNEAAWWWSGALLLLAAAAMLRAKRAQPLPASLIAASIALLVACGTWIGQSPSTIVHFEDEHVTHRGGSLYPHEYHMSRFFYPGGWILYGGDSVSFLYAAGDSTLHYAANDPVSIRLDDEILRLPATGGEFHSAHLALRRTAGRFELEAVEGMILLDRIERRRAP